MTMDKNENKKHSAIERRKTSHEAVFMLYFIDESIEGKSKTLMSWLKISNECLYG